MRWGLSNRSSPDALILARVCGWPEAPTFSIWSWRPGGLVPVPKSAMLPVVLAEPGVGSGIHYPAADWAPEAVGEKSDLNCTRSGPPARLVLK